jgi:hypothetical protein
MSLIVCVAKDQSGGPRADTGATRTEYDRRRLYVVRDKTRAHWFVVICEWFSARVVSLVLTVIRARTQGALPCLVDYRIPMIPCCLKTSNVYATRWMLGVFNVLNAHDFWRWAKRKRRGLLHAISLSLSPGTSCSSQARIFTRFAGIDTSVSSSSVAPTAFEHMAREPL